MRPSCLKDIYTLARELVKKFSKHLNEAFLLRQIDYFFIVCGLSRGLLVLLDGKICILIIL